MLFIYLLCVLSTIRYSINHTLEVMGSSENILTKVLTIMLETLVALPFMVFLSTLLVIIICSIGYAYSALFWGVREVKLNIGFGDEHQPILFTFICIASGVSSLTFCDKGILWYVIIEGLFGYHL